MARTFADDSRKRRARAGSPNDDFRCGHCHRLIGQTVSGGRNRNHCPFCLYSRHVDEGVPGDRASDCGSLMEPVGVFLRPKGEQVVVHRCRGCGFERYCRVAADDDEALVDALPEVEPRHEARGNNPLDP